VQLCVAGGTRVIHAFVCAMVELKRAGDDRVQQALAAHPLLVYVLPTSGDVADNTLAEYIGRADGWYARHVLTSLSAEVSAAFASC
jgi:hypothetical protein